jgi:hypothetical protein
MTVVTDRPVEVDTPTPVYRRTLKSGLINISLANGVIACWALLLLVFVSVPLGLFGLAFAATIGVCDARFNTPTALDVSPAGVELSYWKRTKVYDAKDVVLTHDVPRRRLHLARRGSKRALLRFTEEDKNAVRPFMAAGVEIISR